MSRIKRMKAKQSHERRVLKKEQELAELEREREEDPEEELVKEVDQITPEPETLEKYYDSYGMPMPAPTSFDELDAMEAAREQAENVEEVTWNVRQLVNNILYDPSSDPKAKSQKIQKVASEFENRVSQAMAEPISKDMDLLQLEAILAADARHTGVLEKGVDFIKETLSGSARKKLSDEDFALPESRKYPIHDKAHVRNALARAAQQIKAGGAGAEDARKALPKIRAAAKKFGIETDASKSIIIEKDAKGDWRWIGIPTNNFIDWQKDIIAKSAHEKFVSWLDANPDCAPVFLSWHTPGTARQNPADFWMEKDGAVIMSGILTEDEAAALLTVQKEIDLGMSLQAFALRLDASDSRVVTDYWMYEVSDLPLDRAANPFTTLETMTKEVGMDKLDYLTKIMGSEEKAKAFLEKTGQMQKNLQEAGITSKEKEEQPAATAAAAVPEPKTPEVDVAAIVKQITDQIGKELDLDGLNAFVAQAQEAIGKVEVLEGVVKELSASNDEQLAKALTPPVSRFAWSQSNRASQSDATKLKKDKEEDKQLSDSAPGVPEDYWLSKATGTVPISVDAS